MHKHHHLDAVVTQKPACFERKKKAFVVKKLVPRPSTCSRLVWITAFPDDRPESAVSSIYSFRIIREAGFLCGNPQQPTFFVRADGGLFAY
jgi:hypothetical protein